MILDALFFLLLAVLNLAWWAVMIAVIVQLLIQFGVLDTRNRFVWSVADFFYRLTDPVFRRVRNRLPNFGPVDLAPLVILLLLHAGWYLVRGVQNHMIVGGYYF